MTDFLTVPVQEFIDQTAAKAPTPGGGSVAALCGALAAALAQMALQYTVGKKAFAEHEEELRRSLAALAAARARFQELIAEDIAAYTALSGLLKLPEDLRHKNPEFAPAVFAAIRAPETAMGLAMHVLELCAALLDKTNRHLVSDLGIAAAIAHATVHASELNVLVNLPLVADRQQADNLRQLCSDTAQKSNDLYGEFREHLLKKFA